MSRHIYRSPSQTGIWVEVDLGWDRDKQSLFCIVWPLEQTTSGPTLYDMATDERASPKDLSHLLAQLIQRFSIVLPQDLLVNLLHDVLRNANTSDQVY